MYTIKQKFKGNFFKLSRKAPELFGKEIRIATEKGVNLLHSKVVPQTPVDQGITRNSITTFIQGKAVDINGVVGSPLGHILPLEHGRKKGSMPPVDVITRWFQHKGLSPEKGRTIRQSVFLIARGIARRGFKGRPNGWRMFSNTFMKEKQKVVGFYERAMVIIVGKLN